MRLPIRLVPAQSSTLADRGVELAKAGGAMDMFKTILSDPYHPDDNPDGFINIGTAENYLMIEEVAEFANKHIQFDLKDFTYGEGPWGSPRLRNAMAKFINRRFHPRREIDADHLVFANGVTAICEMLGLTICNAGDGILFSRPIYQAFKTDFGLTANVQPVFVDFKGIDQFSPDAVANYEKTLIKAQENGIRIRALMLCHPHNPLGQCYPRETLIAIMQLCNKYKIHLIADEIYAMSIYNIPDANAVQFESILSLDTDRYIDHKYLHHLYGMSKDTAASGLRLGVIHTLNPELLRALAALSAFHWSGSPSERVAILMLEDEKWMTEFLNRSRERLASRNKLVRQILDEEGIQYRKGANAGFFIWVDFRPFLPDLHSIGSVEGRMEAKAKAQAKERDKPVGENKWKSEDKLLNRFMANKVYVTNGKEMAAEEPGWFRVIYSQDERVIREGLRRVLQVLKG